MVKAEYNRGRIEVLLLPDADDLLCIAEMVVIKS